MGQVRGYFIPSEASVKPGWIQPGKNFRDSAAVTRYVFALQQKARNKGYDSFSIDSIEIKGKEYRVYYYLGSRSLSGLTLVIPDSIRRICEMKVKTTVTPNQNWIQAENWKEKAITALENNGYPFASAEWLEQSGDTLILQVSPNDLVKIDSIIIEGKVKISRSFLYRYLGVKPGKPYNESMVRKIDQRIDAMEFAESSRPSLVRFSKGGANVQLALKDRKASQFNFIMGLLPGSSGRKVLITGDALLNLFSPFGAGEQIFLQWQKLQPKTQKLIVSFSYPYLAGLPVGVSAKLDFFKRDTSWIDLNWDYGVQYQMAGLNYIKLGVAQKRAIPLNADTAYVKLTGKLPGALDISTTQAHVELNFQNLDYRFNPTSGWFSRTGISGGVKKIKPQEAIVNLTNESTGKTYAYLFDSVRSKHFQITASVQLDKYWKIGKRMTLKTGMLCKFVYSSLLAENDLFRLGGTSSLRGFDEETFYTPAFAVLQYEFRYLLSKNSFYYLFFNHAAVARNWQNNPWIYPYGFGTGVSVETKAGIFAISYAMGTVPGTAFSWKSGKIHFGYINYF